MKGHLSDLKRDNFMTVSEHTKLHFQSVKSKDLLLSTF